MLGKVLGDLREKPDVGKSAWWTAWKTDFGKSALGAAWKTDVGKVRWAVCGKLMLEKVHDELREKLMLEKCLANCWESLCWKRCLVSCVENCRESDRKGVVSRKQSYKPQVEKTTVQASVGHGNESCFTYFITNFSEIITCLTTFWWNVTICAVWRMLTKCRILRALTHFGKMLRFTHFARHKILAARHFQLFCTPGGGYPPYRQNQQSSIWSSPLRVGAASVPAQSLPRALLPAFFHGKDIVVEGTRQFINNHTPVQTGLSQ